MRIAVNTRFLLKGKLEGIGWFSYETMRRIVRGHPEHEFIFFFDRPYSDSFIFESNVQGKVLRPPARHPLLWKTWFDYSVPWGLKRCKPDLFVSLDGFCSLRTSVPTHLVIHDLGFEHYEGHTPQRVGQFYRKYTPLYARMAKRIATVSEFSRNDISVLYGIDADLIDVVYNGANESFRPLNGERIEKVKAELTGGADYLVYVGAIQPRKNVDGLFRSFDLFKERNPGPVKLVIAGRMAWQTDEVHRIFKAMKHRGDVVFTGHLLPERLTDVVGAARALVLPSFFEGFGIPVLEAIYAGVPVVTSNASAMPEVAGEAGLLVDPHSDEQIAEAMRRICYDDDLRADLIAAGENQRIKFSWDKTADNLWLSIEKTAATVGLLT